MAHPEIYLKKNEDKRLRKGHLWVFSNEVDTKRSPLEQFSPGDLAQVKSEDGKTLGTAYVNPQALICARLLSRKPNLKCGVNFFKDRLTTALALREKIFDKPYYRLVFGESDGLPGLVIDRFGSVLSVQITTAGIERRKEAMLAALVELVNPVAIILKNDNSQRQLEGLSLESEIAYGQLPDSIWSLMRMAHDLELILWVDKKPAGFMIIEAVGHYWQASQKINGYWIYFPTPEHGVFLPPWLEHPKLLALMPLKAHWPWPKKMLSSIGLKIKCVLFVAMFLSF